MTESGFPPAATMLCAALVLAAIAGPSHASTVPASTYFGSLSADDDVALVTFNLATPGSSDVRFETFSYAGGTLSNGTTVAAGGFDPIISVFDHSGALIDYSDDGAGRFDPVTGEQYDSRVDLRLRAGSYTVAISQYSNFPLGDLLDGFSRSGADFTSEFGCSNGRFCAFGGYNRTADYALEVTAAPVPLPPAIPLLASGIGALFALRLGRRST